MPELERLGHRCSTPDLPLDDPNGASEWADVVVATFPDTGEPIVVVGHSLSGLCLPVIAARHPVSRLLYLGAMVPVPGRAFSDVLAEEPDAIKTLDIQASLQDGVLDGDGDAVMSYERARAMFYGDLDEATARAAWRRLRPQGVTVFTEVCPVEQWPEVATTYVMMTDDGSVGQEWSRRVATGRLGADLIEIPGSHSPFYSRPAELAELLDTLAPQTAAG